MKLLRVGVTRAAEELAALARHRVVEVTGDRSGARCPTPGSTSAPRPCSTRSTAADVVAFLDFDQELLAPRYRAAEEALALLARAVPLLGGRRRDGRLLLQTRLPDHEVVQAALHADPTGSAAAELERRRILGYPPATAMAAVSGAVADAVRRRASRASRSWARATAPGSCGPRTTPPSCRPLPPPPARRAACASTSTPSASDHSEIAPICCGYRNGSTPERRRWWAMRIIGGSARGRKLVGPSSAGTRPLSDRAREALFNILGPGIRGERVLDLFAGTGAVGLEAISRGALSATFVERDRKALGDIQRNLDTLGFGDQGKAVSGDALGFLGRTRDVLRRDLRRPAPVGRPLEDDHRRGRRPAGGAGRRWGAHHPAGPERGRRRPRARGPGPGRRPHLRQDPPAVPRSPPARTEGVRRRFDDEERRARLGRRHHLSGPAPSVEVAAGDLVGLHSSDPPPSCSPARARRPGPLSPSSRTPSTRTARWSACWACAGRCSSCPGTWPASSMSVAHAIWPGRSASGWSG